MRAMNQEKAPQINMISSTTLKGISWELMKAKAYVSKKENPKKREIFPPQWRDGASGWPSGSAGRPKIMGSSQKASNDEIKPLSRHNPTKKTLQKLSHAPRRIAQELKETEKADKFVGLQPKRAARNLTKEHGRERERERARGADSGT